MYQKIGVGMGFMFFMSTSLAESNVQLYGLIDQGLRFNVGSQAVGSRLSIHEGNTMSSRFGLKGREEFTARQAIFFNLEGDIHPKHQGNSIFMKRQMIGYENGDYGQVSLGLQSSVSFDIARQFDPSGFIHEKYVADDLSGTFNGRYGNKWSEHLLKYALRTKDSQVLTSYQMNNGESNQGPNYALGFSHRFANTVLASSYSTMNNPAVTHRSGDATIFNAGIAQYMGPTVLKIGYSQSNLAQSHRSSWIRPTLAQVQNFGIGFKHQVSQPLEIYTAFYHQKNQLSHMKSDGNKYVLGSKYHLSKQTHLYGYLHHANGSDYGRKIPTRTGLSLGVVHRF